MLHPEKTKIVYCKDANRRRDYPKICFDFLGFQFRARKTMWTVKGGRVFAHGFLPAVSPKARVRIGREIRSWALHQRSDKSMEDLAAMYNSKNSRLDRLLQPLLSDVAATLYRIDA